VLKAAVVGLRHDHWGEAVTAVVVAAPHTAPGEQTLITWCRERLAGFETPKRVIFVDALPETVGGKVLKYRLRAEFADTYLDELT
jgi:acyl-coenzyme A synthetase/AMP-(fatty) acid ligase